MPEIVDFAGARAAFAAAGSQLRAHGVNWIAIHAGEHLLFEDMASVLAAARIVASRPGISADDLIAALDAPPAEAPQAWTAACATCGQGFISDTPVVDGAVCPSCSTTATGAPMTIATAPATQRDYITPDTDSQPLILLLGALDDHAKHLPKPLPRDYAIPLPLTLPSRLSVPIGLVVPGRYQPRTRFDTEKLAELAGSIAEHGILNPMLVFANEKGKLELIAGERRLRAAQQAGLTMVPIEIRSYTLKQIDEISTIDNLQRDDLSPIEEGVAYERMIREWGVSENELAKRLSKNRAYIQHRRALASAAPEVLQALDAGAITFSQARGIAIAAPGDLKAQKAAVKKIEEMTKHGSRTTEADARHIAEKIVIAKAKQALEALGWVVSERGDGVLIWASSEKPRSWTGAEIAEAVTSKRGPAGTPPAAADEHLLRMLKLRYRVNRDYTPWVCLSDDTDPALAFYAASEVAALPDAITEEWQACQARAEAAGWALTVADVGTYSQANFLFNPAKGSGYSVWGWAEMQKGLAGIESGKVKPTLSATQSHMPTMYTCDQCKKKTKDYNYVEGKHLCNGCAKAAKAAITVRQQQVGADVRRIMEAWLTSAPVEALRLLAALYNSRPYDAIQTAALADHLRARSVADIAAALIDKVADRADEYHRQGRTLYDPPAALLPGSTRRTPAPAAPADDSPLAAVRAALVNIELTIGEEPALLEDGEITVILADLDAMAKTLEGLADAPDVATQDYETLSASIGSYRWTLRELLKKAVNV